MSNCCKRVVGIVTSSRVDSVERGLPWQALPGRSPGEPARGHEPFLLVGSDVWRVEKGSVELFLVRMREGRLEGSKRHLVTAKPGTLLFGLPPFEAGEGSTYALQAAPHPHAVLHATTVETLREFSHERVSELAPAIQAWVQLIADGLTSMPSGRSAGRRQLRPRRSLAEEAGEAVAPDEQAVCASRPKLDFSHPDRLWTGLQAWHQTILPTAANQQLEWDKHERERLRSRTSVAQQERAGGLNQLRGVLDFRRSNNSPPNSHQSPVLLALQLVGQREGFSVQAPLASDVNNRHHELSLSEVLQASGLRARRVRLQVGWERFDVPAMLGFARDDGRPLAILPKKGRGLEVIDPTRQITLHDREALNLLADHAFVLTAPLPLRSLTWKALPQFTMARGWGDLLTVVFTALVGGLLAMAVPIASAYLIDTVIPGHDKNHLVQIGLILVVLTVAGFVMSFVGNLAFSRFQARAGTALQSAIIDRLLRLPVGFFRRYSAGDLASRASAVTQIDQLIANSVSQALVGSVFALFSFALLLYYDWILGLWALALTVFYLAVSLLLIWLQLHQERGLARLDGQVQSLTLQLVTGIGKIRTAGAEDRVFSRWAQLFSGMPTRVLAAARSGNLLIAFHIMYTVIPLIVFFLILGRFRSPDEVNVFLLGGLAAFLAAFNNFRDGTSQVTQTIVAALAAQPLLERALPILEAEPEANVGKENPGPLAGAIGVHEVSFRYEADGPLVLENVSLVAKAGEFMAIVGPSGSGKSTLLRLLLGFETPSAGRITFDGNDLSDLDLPAVRRQMGVVLQNSRLLPGSIYDNVVGVAEINDDEVWEALSRVGLLEEVERMPMGLRTLVTEAGSLSGGQAQRLLLARAIVRQPRILLLDEATSALDNRKQALITESLERLSVTRIVVAHRLSTVARADRIVVLDAGRVVEEGSYEQLMHNNRYFKRLVAAQLL